MENEFYCQGFIPQPPSPGPCPTPGPGWSRPGDINWADPLLRRVYCDSRGAFWRPEADGFSLAYPLSCRSPFPLPPLFCFARVECLGSRGWWVFSFTADGLPRLGE